MNRSEVYNPGWDKAGAAPAARPASAEAADEGQYSLFKILAIWAAAVVPMVLLGWIVAPLIGDRVDLGVGAENREIFARACLLTLGLVWQFVLVMVIIFREEGDLRWSTIRRRCWLNAPRDPKTGRTRSKLWLWLVPLLIAVAALQMAPLQDLWEKAFPFLGEPDKYSFNKLMLSEDRKAALEGAWQVLGMFIVLGIFNTVIGEELLFRGVLLPKMQRVFGRGDWLANGVLFGLYHLHQPWSIPGSAIEGSVLEALTSKRYRSAWMAIVVHSGQSVFFIVMALGLVLGLA